MNVHVLATVLNPDLIANTLMVFDTIRVGFPTANIHVFGNGLNESAGVKVHASAYKVGASFNPIERTITHGEWIESLVQCETSPFWICDTDVIFHAKVEHWFDSFHGLFAGRYEPEFFEQWTQSLHVARLHPSLMWLNPRPLRAAIRGWPGKHKFYDATEKTLIQWAFVPHGGRLLFYDTCAGLHHALTGERFTKDQNDCFTHRFCGTYADLIQASEDALKCHEDVCKNWPSEEKPDNKGLDLAIKSG